MKLKKKVVPKDAGAEATFKMSHVTENEFTAICKGLELLEDSNEKESVLACNMLRRMDPVRKG